MELENLIWNFIWLKTAGERGRKRAISIIYFYIILFKIYSIENFSINNFILDWFRKSGEQRDCDGHDWICYSYNLSIRKRFTFAPIQNDQSGPGISRSRKSGTGPGTRLLIKSGTETGTQIQNLRDSGPEPGLCIFLFETKIFYKSRLCPGSGTGTGAQIYGTQNSRTQLFGTVRGTKNFPGHGPGPVPTPALYCLVTFGPKYFEGWIFAEL